MRTLIVFLLVFTLVGLGGENSQAQQGPLAASRSSVAVNIGTGKVYAPGWGQAGYFDFFRPTPVWCVYARDPWTGIWNSAGCYTWPTDAYQWGNYLRWRGFAVRVVAEYRW